MDHIKSASVLLGHITKSHIMTHKLIETALLEQALDAMLTAKVWHAPARHKAYVYPKCMEAITAVGVALANAEPAGCLWSKDPDFEMGDTYDSACGEKWSFIDGGPTENRVKFCQRCGRPVKLINEQP